MIQHPKPATRIFGVVARAAPPPDVRAIPIAPWAGHGEDEPEWTLADEGEISDYRSEGFHRYEFLRPQRCLKTQGDLILERRIFGMFARNGPNYTREHRLLDRADDVVLDLGRSDWADWSRSGELLLARDGRVFRVPIDRKGNVGKIDELIDLRSLRFEKVPPPPAALTWNERVTGRRIT